MKFPKLQIENFLAITEAEIDLSDRGLVLIQGVNSVDSSTQSNGAGKSTIADALCWALYGVTARGITGDDVINRDAGKGTRVAVTIQDGGIAYTITRHRKHKKGKNTLTVTQHDGLREIDLTKGTDKLTQEVVTKVVGASLDVFAGAIYAGQEKMPDLPAMTDKMLKMVIEEAAGVTLLEDAYTRARAAMNAVKTDLASAQSKLEQMNSGLAWLDSQIVNVEAAAADWETQREQRREQARRTAQAAKPKLEEIKAEIDKLGSVEKIDASIAELDRKVAAVDGEQKRMVELERHAAAMSGDLSAAINAEKQAKGQLERAECEVQTVRNRIGEACTECGRPMTEHELGDAEAAAKRRADALREELTRRAERVTDARQALSEAETARDTHRASLTDLSAVHEERKRLEGIKKQIATLEGSYREVHGEAKRQIEEFKRIAAEENPYTKQVAQLRSDRQEKLDEIKDQEARIEALAKRLEVEEQVVRVFSPAGVRARILDEVTPLLNAQTSKYLSTLSDGHIDAVWSTVTLDKKGNAKEKFAIDVVNSTGASVFKGLSGGEKRKVRVATALALQDLVAIRATKPIELFIGDEIDDALDAAGIERLTTVLEEKARERGSVFIISHNEIRDMVRNVMTVEKTSGGTVITESQA